VLVGLLDFAEKLCLLAFGSECEIIAVKCDNGTIEALKWMKIAQDPRKWSVPKDLRVGIAKTTLN